MYIQTISDRIGILKSTVLEEPVNPQVREKALQRLLVYTLLVSTMTNLVEASSDDLEMISKYGWSGVFSVVVQYEQEISNPEVQIPQSVVQDPDNIDEFNDGTIDRITDELGSVRKRADRVYRANVRKNSMHIRVYDDKGVYRAEIDSHNPSSDLSSAVKHFSQDLVSRA